MELEQEEQELEQLQEELEEDEEQQYRCPHYKRKCQFVVSSGVLAGARMQLLAGVRGSLVGIRYQEGPPGGLL